MPRDDERTWDERGSRNEKVVSSAGTSSVTIFILHQSPFRFTAAAAGYVFTMEKASYHEVRLYGTPNLLSLVIDDRFSTSLLSANLRFSAPGFDTCVTTGSLGRDRTPTRWSIGASSIDPRASIHPTRFQVAITVPDTMMPLHFPENSSFQKSFFTTVGKSRDHVSNGINSRLQSDLSVKTSRSEIYYKVLFDNFSSFFVTATLIMPIQFGNRFLVNSETKMFSP